MQGKLGRGAICGPSWKEESEAEVNRSKERGVQDHFEFAAKHRAKTVLIRHQVFGAIRKRFRIFLEKRFEFSAVKIAAENSMSSDIRTSD